MSLKGQMNYDFIFAFVLFLLAYTTVFSFLPFLTIGSMEEPDILVMESALFSEVLVKSPGYPKNWTEISDNIRLGLVYYNVTYYPNILDYQKVSAINSASCSALYSKTDIDIKFMIRVETSSATYNCSGTIPSDARLIERAAFLFNGTTYWPAKLKLYTWL